MRRGSYYSRQVIINYVKEAYNQGINPSADEIIRINEIVEKEGKTFSEAIKEFLSRRDKQSFFYLERKGEL